MAEVTVVIPNYNGKTLLENCIKTLEQQTLRDFKLLVIDNGSTDGSTELTSEILDMEIVELGENTGFCKAVAKRIRRLFAVVAYLSGSYNADCGSIVKIGHFTLYIKHNRRIIDNR